MKTLAPQNSIKARYGTLPHLVFMVFGLVTNILVSLMLVVGGSATVSALTGMHTIAAIYLLPVGVIAYTMVGGLKATILTDWVHTFWQRTTERNYQPDRHIRDHGGGNRRYERHCL